MIRQFGPVDGGALVSLEDASESLALKSDLDVGSLPLIGITAGAPFKYLRPAFGRKANRAEP